jgi:hypothetical protein
VELLESNLSALDAVKGFFGNVISSGIGKSFAQTSLGQYQNVMAKQHDYFVYGMVSSIESLRVSLKRARFLQNRVAILTSTVFLL